MEEIIGILVTVVVFGVIFLIYRSREKHYICPHCGEEIKTYVKVENCPVCASPMNLDKFFH